MIILLDETNWREIAMVKQSKFYLVIIGVILQSHLLYGQMGRGEVLLSGLLDIKKNEQKIKSGGQTTEGPRNIQFQMGVSGAYFLYQHLTIGAGFLYHNENDRYLTTFPYTEVITKSGSFGIRPFVQYYLINSGSFGVFGETSLELRFGSESQLEKYQTTEITRDYSTYYYALGFSPGINYFMTERFGLTLYTGFIGLARDRKRDKSGETDKDFLQATPSFSLNLRDLKIGLLVKL